MQVSLFKLLGGGGFSGRPCDTCTMARAAGDWLLAHPYRSFGEAIGGNDRFFYSTYYCSQATERRLLGGLYPPLTEAMLGAQLPDGSWPPEPNHGDAVYGNLYTTAMAVLSLTPPYQLLRAYQR